MFLGFTYQKSLKSVNVWQSYSKNKKVGILDIVYRPILISVSLLHVYILNNADCTCMLCCHTA